MLSADLCRARGGNFVIGFININKYTSAFENVRLYLRIVNWVTSVSLLVEYLLYSVPLPNSHTSTLLHTSVRCKWSDVCKFNVSALHNTSLSSHKYTHVCALVEGLYKSHMLRLMFELPKPGVRMSSYL